MKLALVSSGCLGDDAEYACLSVSSPRVRRGTRGAQVRKALIVLPSALAMVTHPAALVAQRRLGWNSPGL